MLRNKDAFPDALVLERYVFSNSTFQKELRRRSYRENCTGVYDSTDERMNSDGVSWQHFDLIPCFYIQLNVLGWGCCSARECW